MTKGSHVSLVTEIGLQQLPPLQTRRDGTGVVHESISSVCNSVLWEQEHAAGEENAECRGRGGVEAGVEAADKAAQGGVRGWPDADGEATQGVGTGEEAGCKDLGRQRTAAQGERGGNQQGGRGLEWEGMTHTMQRHRKVKVNGDGRGMHGVQFLDMVMAAPRVNPSANLSS
ncbi:hypothetical protein BJV78DRAFT_1156029 [Lactifluus subvellereus]|nr:hypothetical protein BJV78DRAFT_1156029 [Lactifluus subvellereus]